MRLSLRGGPNSVEHAVKRVRGECVLSRARVRASARVDRTTSRLLSCLRLSDSRHIAPPSRYRRVLYTFICAVQTFVVALGLLGFAKFSAATGAMMAACSSAAFVSIFCLLRRAGVKVGDRHRGNGGVARCLLSPNFPSISP